MGITLALTTVLVIIITLKYLWDRRYLYYHSRKISGPTAYPFIGSVLSLIGHDKDQVNHLNGLFEQYGKIFKFWIGGSMLVCINDPENIKKVLSVCVEKEPFYQFGRSLVGEGLFTATGLKWKRNRKVMALLFNPKILNSFVDIFVNYSNILVDKLEENVGQGHFNVYPLLQRYTLDIICETSMGVSVNAMNGENKYGYWMTRAESLVVSRFFLPHLYPNFIWNLTQRSKSLEMFCKSAWNFVENALKKRSKSTAETTKCFLDYLSEVTTNITTEELVQEAQTMVLAGSETTATAESTILLMLAMHQDVQMKVYEELKEIYGTSSRPVEREDLSRMVYLEKVIKETMRLLPIAPMFVRFATKDIELDSAVIPRGSSILIPVISLHRNPQVWDDPLKFNPERFSPEEISKRHPCAFIPFASGPRNCIGMRYAMMSIKIMLATVLRKYKIISTEYKSIDDIQIKIKIVSKFRQGHKIRIEKRV